MDKLLLEDNEVVFLSGKRPFLRIRALRSIAQNHSFYKANYYCHILKKSNVSDSLVIGANFLQKQVNHSTNSYFLYVFPFLYPRANPSHRSSLIRSFLKRDLSNLLTWLFTKERLWVIHSGRSWQKSDWIDLFFFTSESLFRSQKNSKSLEKPMSKFPTMPDSPVLNG